MVVKAYRPHSLFEHEAESLMSILLVKVLALKTLGKDHDWLRLTGIAIARQNNKCKPTYPNDHRHVLNIRYMSDYGVSSFAFLDHPQNRLLFSEELAYFLACGLFSAL